MIRNMLRVNVHYAVTPGAAVGGGWGAASFPLSLQRKSGMKRRRSLGEIGLVKNS